jgi:hypothetical protein
MRLRSKFESICRQLLHRSSLPTIESALSELLAEETRLQTLVPTAVSSDSHALAVIKSFSSNMGGTLTCRYCKEEGHHVSQCRRLQRKLEREAKQPGPSSTQPIVAAALVETSCNSSIEDQIAQLRETVQALSFAANNNLSSSANFTTTSALDSSFQSSDW